jgi:hypothetical protein
MKGNILNFIAKTDIPKFRFVQAGDDSDTVKLAEAGAEALGVSMDIDVKKDWRCDTQLDGVHMIELGAAVGFGDKLAPDAEGRAIVATELSYGIALDKGVAGDIIRLKIVPGIHADLTATQEN